ncbi:hypothetical protein M569_11457, partial [Genlisea aurea]
MGAPKQKWTSEEEAALKAGIQKYGAGKWSTILKDPEFNVILRSRSNVDLKDKWRNLNCMASGLGSRHRSSVSMRSSSSAPKNDEDAAAVNGMEIDREIVPFDATTPVAASNAANLDSGSKNQISRLEDVIMEAVSKLKEPRGSSRQSILDYVEDHYMTPPEFGKILSARLKLLTENGKLIKVKHQYRIAPSAALLNPSKVPTATATGVKRDGCEDSVVVITKAQVDAELEKMKCMTAEEAAAAAAQAVAEAEAAIEAAEIAAREAEEAEAEAEAARCFAIATRKAL